MMPDPVTLYLLTVSPFCVGLFAIWILRILSTGKIVLLLFALDISLTVEAALYSDIVLIAVLHVITIPAFFGLIYFDLVKQHNSDFRCFICGKMVKDSEDIQIIKRYIKGVKRDLTVHRECISLDQKQRKAFSRNTFRKGIPE